MRRRTRWLMEVKLKVRGPTPLSRLCLLQQPLLLWFPLKMVELRPSKLLQNLCQTLEGQMLFLFLLIVALSDHLGAVVMGDPSTSRTSRPASGN